MSGLLDFPRLSTFIKGVIDREVKGITNSISSSTGYLKSLVTQSAASANASLAYSGTAAGSATDSANSAAAALKVWKDFTSTYGGVQATNPTTSSLGNPFNANAFFIKSTSGRLKYATIDANGNVVWADAKVAADPDSVLAICKNKFLDLTLNTPQRVLGPIDFAEACTVIDVTDWTTKQPTPASGVAAKIKVVSDALATESTRAQSAEGANTTAIASEKTRAQNAESANATAIGNETTRAQNAEQALGGVISNEITRAQNAESANATAIAANTKAIGDEVTRAKSAESANTTLINNETTRAQNAESANTTAIGKNTNNITTLNTTLSNLIAQFTSGSNANGNWETRPNIIEQWGFVAATSTADEPVISVNLAVQLPDTAYHVYLTPVLNNPSNAKDTWVQEVRTSKGQNSFGVQYQRPGTSSSSFGLDGFEWMVKYVTGETNNSDQNYNGSSTSAGTATANTNTGTCPSAVTPILLANDTHDGPGKYVFAGSVKTGEYVWTQHEDTFEWGAYPVTVSSPFLGDLWYAEGYYRATADHPFYIDGEWVKMEDIGAPSSPGVAVKLTIDDAHTFVSHDLSGNEVLNHNKQAQGQLQ